MHLLKTRKSVMALILFGSSLAVITLAVLRYRTRPPLVVNTTRLDVNWTEAGQPLWYHFLDEQFLIIMDVRSLPAPVRQAFTDPTNLRPLMANPDDKFEVGDVILDPSLPRKRLILAGVSGWRCFVHYVQGGRGVSYPVEFFDSAPDRSVLKIWKGNCKNPATNIEELRRCVADEYRNSLIPR
jgi:hypothetical protein